jgi:NADH-quinone oxidoreductase subunit H
MTYCFVVSALLLTFFALFAGPVSWFERRIAGRIMSRIGPNRVGPQGVIQWLADGLKNFLKEDLIPASADRLLFRFAPYPVFVGVTLTLVTLPFSSLLIGADLNVGVIYIVGAWGLVVVGLLAAGWASNSKWTLLGGFRSAAQMVSYEIPLVTSLLVPVLLAGSMSLQTIISAQGWHPTDWFVFSNPFASLAFLIVFIAAVAESNRTPFDIPEAESELVNGYNTEYSGMRFLFFFFAEWGNIYVISALFAAIFFGGWQVPPVWREWSAGYGGVLPHVLEVIVFQVKAWFFVLLIIQLRWTLPRLRVDQLMKLSWKYLLPFAFVSVIGNAVWMAALPKGWLFMRYLLFFSAVALAVYFVWRVFWQLRWTRSKVDMKWVI